MSTIREHIERNDELSVECANPICRHMGVLDLPALRRRFGGDLDVIDRRQVLLARCVCTQCGERFPSLLISTGRH